MSFELALTPGGRVVVLEPVPDTSVEHGGGGGKALQCVAAQFEQSPSAGLFALGNVRLSAAALPSVRFWGEFASDFLAALCRAPLIDGDADSAPDVVAPPDDAALARRIRGAPPLPGGEYLDTSVLTEIWRALDDWIREAAGGSGDGFEVWLERSAPAFYGIGRVGFHLAENRLDPERPFAFLATYAPRLGPSGRVLYKALGQALEEFAGEKNRAALVRLLRPVHAASESCAWVKVLVDSGDVFHPLAWTQAEAYRFLTDVPALESSGLVVRVPDWWRARSRPPGECDDWRAQRGRVWR